MSGNISIVHEEPEPDDDEQLYADLSLAQLALSNTLPPPLLSPQLSFRPAMSSPTTNTFRDITAEFLRASERMFGGAGRARMHPADLLQS